MSTKLDQIYINTIRTLSMDAVQKANSGHPGAPMGLAPVAYTLFKKYLRYNPKNPDFPNRDRFVLSAGHASMLLYSTLHLFGFDISLEDIKNFRQWDRICAGHPEYGLTPGVETTTGPLGQGFANSVGFAIAEKWLAERFNREEHKIFGYNIFALGGDGCMMEGISSEAASLAGHLGLDNLIWIYDSNGITIEGDTDLAFTEDIEKRFLAYNWNVFHVYDANNLKSLESYLDRALEQEEKPTLIILKSHIAYGSPNKQDSEEAHGAPLGEEEIRLTKENYGWDPEKKFFVPKEVEKLQKNFIQKGQELQKEWEQDFVKYKEKYPDLAKELEWMEKRELPENWEEALPEFKDYSQKMATRKANGKILNAIAKKVPFLLGGSADLAGSNKTTLEGEKSFLRNQYDGRNFHFGVREHAMGAILNGMSLSKLRVYGGTFLVFSDYMRPAIRLSALMHQPVIYILTHDSIGLGEDGPTHQPIEQLEALRAIPNLDVIRPADGNELAQLWKHILASKDRAMALALSRQGLPTIDRKKYANPQSALKGGYILADSQSEPEFILIATGSEVHLCLEAYEKLTSEGVKVRVVSMPCTSLFERQSQEYKEKVLPPTVRKRIAVEAGSSGFWYKYAGLEGLIIGIEHRFGASAPGNLVMEKYGFNVENIIEKSKKLL